MIESARPPQNVAELGRMLASFAPVLNADPPEVGRVHRSVPVRDVGDARVTADIIEPKTAGLHPVLVYLHGGGFVAGNPASHHKLACRFAEAGFLVVNVDYRLAPEAPFPAALDDCVHATRWTARVAERYGGDPSRLAVAGDSAGANLAAAAAGELARDVDAPRISALLLFYGVLDIVALKREPLPKSKDPLFAPGVIDMLIDAYLGPNPPAELVADPRVSPIRQAERAHATQLRSDRNGRSAHVAIAGLCPAAGRGRRAARVHNGPRHAARFPPGGVLSAGPRVTPAGDSIPRKTRARRPLWVSAARTGSGG
jgi:acetyl esterase/lipase